MEGRGSVTVSAMNGEELYGDSQKEAQEVAAQKAVRQKRSILTRQGVEILRRRIPDLVCAAWVF